MEGFTPTQPNPALYTTADHRIYSAESPELHPGPNDCVVHVRVNGICGSDLHFWKHGGIGDLVVNSDYILGHEGAGVVVWAGKDVDHLAIGDRVAIEPGVPCGRCDLCSQGDYNLCEDVAFTGVPHHNGSIRRFHVHQARFLHKLPDNLSFTEGALLEPLSVIMRAFQRSPARVGDPVMICGAGPIGLIALAIARASGAFPIVITDVDERRLAFAKAFEPKCETFHVPMELPPLEVATKIKKIFMDLPKPGLPRAVYECTGVPSSINTAAYCVKRGGDLVAVGVGRPLLDGLPFMHLSMAEVDIKFINRYNHTWPAAMRLLSSGYVDLKPLVTHTYPLESAVAALESVATREQAAIKVHIMDG